MGSLSLGPRSPGNLHRKTQAQDWTRAGGSLRVPSKDQSWQKDLFSCSAFGRASVSHQHRLGAGVPPSSASSEDPEQLRYVGKEPGGPVGQRGPESGREAAGTCRGGGF